jgi:hypothetical protein
LGKWFDLYQPDFEIFVPGSNGEFRNSKW